MNFSPSNLQHQKVHSFSFHYSVNKKNGYNPGVLQVKTEHEYGASQLSSWSIQHFIP